MKVKNKIKYQYTVNDLWDSMYELLTNEEMV